MKGRQLVRRFSIVTAFALGALAALYCGRAPAAQQLYVGNTDSGDVSVVAIPEHRVVSTIDVGAYIDDVTASHDGRVVYANRVESSGHPLSKRIGESGEVVAIDAQTEEILWRVDVHGWPHHMTVTRDDRFVFVPLFNRPYIEVVDTQRRETVGLIPAVIGTHGTRLSPDGRRLYTGSMMMDMLTVFDVESRRPVKRLPTRDAVRPFTMTADEKTLFVQLSRFHGFQVVDLETNQIVREVVLPELPDDVSTPQYYPHTVNHGLELSPDDRYLFAAGSVAGYVCVYELPDLELAATIPVGSEPNWIVFSSQGRFAYVSNRGSDTVSVISVETLSEVEQIDVGQYPQRLQVVTLPESDG